MPTKIVLLIITNVFFSGLCWTQGKNLTMSGFVTDKESRPVEGARVTIVGNKAKADTTTDTEGAFVLNFSQGVAEGEPVRIHIEQIGYKPYEKWVPVSPAIPWRVPLDSIRHRSSALLVPLIPPERTTTEYPPPPNDPWVQTFNGGRCENGVPDITHDLTPEQAIRLAKQSSTHSRMWGLQDVTAKCESNQLGSFATLDFPAGTRSSGSVISYPPSAGASAIKFWIRWNASKPDGSVKWIISEGCVSNNLDVPVPERASIVDPVGETLGLHTLAKLTQFKCKPTDMVVIKIGRYGDQDTGHTIAHLLDFTVEYKRDLGPANVPSLREAESAKTQLASPLLPVSSSDVGTETIPAAQTQTTLPTIAKETVKSVDRAERMRRALTAVISKKDTVTFLITYPRDIDIDTRILVGQILSGACRESQCLFAYEGDGTNLDKPLVKRSGRSGITVHGSDAYALASALGDWFTTHSTSIFPPELNGYNEYKTKEMMWIEIGPSPWKTSEQN